MKDYKLSARTIGIFIENYAIDTFNLEKESYNEYYDAKLLKIPIEIKGIRKKTGITRIRNGSAWITNDNHKKLVENDGFYIFIVYDYKEDIYIINDYNDIDILYTIFISAHRIKINDNHNTKISYTRLLGMI